MAGTHIHLMGSTLTDTGSITAGFYQDFYGGTYPDYFDSYDLTYTGFRSVSGDGPSIGSISGSNFNITNDTIVAMHEFTYQYFGTPKYYEFIFRINDVVPNEGWQQLLINNSSGTRVKTLDRAAANFVSAPGYSRWVWDYDIPSFINGSTYSFYIRQ